MALCGINMPESVEVYKEYRDLSRMGKKSKQAALMAVGQNGHGDAWVQLYFPDSPTKCKVADIPHCIEQAAKFKSKHGRNVLANVLISFPGEYRVYGIEPDLKRAEKLLLELVDEGYSIDGHYSTYQQLHRLYYFEESELYNPEKAAHLAQVFMEKYYSPPTYDRFAEQYFNGVGVEKDLNVVAYCQYLAECGYSSANYELSERATKQLDECTVEQLTSAISVGDRWMENYAGEIDYVSDNVFVHYLEHRKAVNV